MLREDKENNVIEFRLPIQTLPKQTIIATPARYGRAFAREQKVRRNEQQLIRLMRESGNVPAEPLTGPVSLEVVFAYPSKEAGCRPKTTRPDLDNLLKQLCDALQRAGVVANDSVIWRVDARKVEWDGTAVTWIRVSTDLGLECVRSLRGRGKAA